MIVKKSVFVFIFTLIIFSFLYSKAPDNQTITIFNEAKSLFTQANELAEQYPEKAQDYYLKSAVHFESIFLNHGIKNGKLFYNIGNAYFKAGSIGKAILYYKKAEKYIPSDKNLQHNLQYVRSKRVDQISEKEQNRILRVIFFFH
jgi:tetratricopeptide (TPR) repeat protein